VPLSQRILAWLATRDPAAIRQPARRSTLQPPGRRKDLDAIREATIQAAPAIRVLILNDVPRTALSTSEVAEITGMPYTRVLAEIRVGRIRVITGGNQYAQRDHPSARSRSCTGSSPSQTDGAGADIPSRRRACLVAGQEQSPYGATWAAETTWILAPSLLRLWRRRDGIRAQLWGSHAISRRALGRSPRLCPPETPALIKSEIR
jgi:hypothetical protein